VKIIIALFFILLGTYSIAETDQNNNYESGEALERVLNVVKFPVPECENSSDCGYMEHCVSEKCVSKRRGIGCRSNLDCGMFETCQGSTCLRHARECYSDLDCHWRSSCIAGECQ